MEIMPRRLTPVHHRDCCFYKGSLSTLSTCIVTPLGLIVMLFRFPECKDDESMQCGEALPGDLLFLIVGNTLLPKEARKLSILQLQQQH